MERPLSQSKEGIELSLNASAAGLQRNRVESVELSAYLCLNQGIETVNTCTVEDGVIKYTVYGSKRSRTLPLPDGMAAVEISDEINTALPSCFRDVESRMTILVPEDVAPELAALQVQFDQILSRAKEILGEEEE